MRAVDPHPMTGRRRSAASASRVSCISRDDVVVDLVEVGVVAELLAQVDRRQRLDGDLRRQRDVAEEVADVEAPRQRERDRQHLQAQRLVEQQQLARASRRARGTATVSWPPIATTGTIGTSCSSARRIQPLRPPKSTWLRSHDRAGGPRGRRRGRRAPPRRPRAPSRRCPARRRSTPNLRRKPRPGHRHDEVVGERVERALDAEVRAEREREDAAVDGEVAAGVVADQQDRPLLGDVAQPADLAAEVQARQQPQRGQALADVVGVALVEVGGGDAPGDLAGDSARARSGRPRSPPAGAAVRGGVVAVERAREPCRRSRARCGDARVVVPAIGRNRTRCAGRYAATRSGAALAPSGVGRARRSAASRRVDLLGALDLRDVAAVLEDDLLGPRQPALDVALEARRGSAGRACPRRTATAPRARDSRG